MKQFWKDFLAGAAISIILSLFGLTILNLWYWFWWSLSVTIYFLIMLKYDKNT